MRMLPCIYDINHRPTREIIWHQLFYHYLAMLTFADTEQFAVTSCVLLGGEVPDFLVNDEWIVEAIPLQGTLISIIWQNHFLVLAQLDELYTYNSVINTKPCCTHFILQLWCFRNSVCKVTLYEMYSSLQTKLHCFSSWLNWTWVMPFTVGNKLF